MCGITGFVDFSGRSGPESLKRMADALVHRGPDDEGLECLSDPAATVGLGFRRLAIIDLSPAGHQPMRDPADGSWIAFNGEVYNFREIRSELEAAGHTFHSHSDTEVILHALRAWGLAAVDRFIGMFAIAWYRPAVRKLTLLRDRAGVKPLFYYWNEQQFLFGSELKSFHQHPDFRKELDPEALGLFFRFGYIPAPYSIFRNTFKLPPAHWLELDLTSRSITLRQYWNLADAVLQPAPVMSDAEVEEETERLLVSAFQYRMIADVPVGVFLSGGYDSSCVAALLQRNTGSKIRTFTIGFEDERFNEAAHAKKVAGYLGTDHYEHFCTYREAMEIVPRLPEIYDEPFGDQSAVPTTLVSSIARKQVTVALSADGGDELFAGYPRHRKSMGYLNRLSGIPVALRKSASALLPIASGRDLSRADRREKLREFLRAGDAASQFRIINETYTATEAQELIGLPVKPLPTRFDAGAELARIPDPLQQVLTLEYQTYLVEDILQKVDRATMSVSLEGREPFLDHRIAEWVGRLPSRWKMDDTAQKILLKKIVHRHIPRELMERPKMGFGVPLVDWLKTDLRPFLEHALREGSFDHGLLDPRQVGRLKSAYLAGRLENFERLWYVLMFQTWYDRWMR
ncbi:MAG TPA: asparagine synthase (glutamine-hydrolyzing) [Bacteroidia bacterium]|nr:asparagine synthase (glutamine-hydrolyzing) [Bacteroidia bacterium]